MALYCLRTKSGIQLVMQHNTAFTKTQVYNFIANFKTKLKAEQAATGGITKAMAFEKFIAELKSRGFTNVTYQAAIYITGDSLDFLIE